MAPRLLPSISRKPTPVFRVRACPITALCKGTDGLEKKRLGVAGTAALPWLAKENPWGGTGKGDDPGW